MTPGLVDRLRGGRVHDVEAGPGPGGDARRPAHRFDLALGPVASELGVLAVHRDGHVVGRGHRAPGGQGGLVDGREVVPAAGAGERLGAGRAGRQHRGQHTDRRRDEPGPQCDVDAAAGAGGGDLGLERGERGRRWIAVDRHVDHRRDPAGHGRCAATIEPLPRLASRVVEVDVGVDRAGQYEEPAGVDDERTGAARGSGRGQLDDHAVDRHHVEVGDPLGQHHPATPHDEGRHAPPAGAMPCSASNAGHTCGS